MENKEYNKNLKTCKYCGNMIAKQAKTCPRCGGRNKPPTISKILKAIVIIIIAFIVIDVVVYFLSNNSLYGKYDYDITSQLSEEEYKAECISLSYEELARNPGEYEGELLKFTGEVYIKCYDSDGFAEYLIAVTREDVGNEYYSYTHYIDNIYAYYHYGENDKLLEGDIVTIYGVGHGEITYENVSGSKITVPAFEIIYVEL